MIGTGKRSTSYSSGLDRMGSLTEPLHWGSFFFLHLNQTETLYYYSGANIGFVLSHFHSEKEMTTKESEKTLTQEAQDQQNAAKQPQQPHQGQQVPLQQPGFGGYAQPGMPAYGMYPMQNNMPLFNQPIQQPVNTMKEKTLFNSDISGARKNVKDIQIVGNSDQFRLLFKASSQEEGWMKSTKAMEVPGGCVVQVTTQQRNPDGSYAVAEALTFVPNVKIQDDVNGGRKLC
jgi:hypothetical protein